MQQETGAQQFYEHMGTAREGVRGMVVKGLWGEKRARQREAGEHKAAPFQPAFLARSVVANRKELGSGQPKQRSVMGKR